MFTIKLYWHQITLTYCFQSDLLILVLAVKLKLITSIDTEMFFLQQNWCFLSVIWSWVFIGSNTSRRRPAGALHQ